MNLNTQHIIVKNQECSPTQNVPLLYQVESTIQNEEIQWIIFSEHAYVEKEIFRGKSEKINLDTTIPNIILFISNYSILVYTGSYNNYGSGILTFVLESPEYQKQSKTQLTITSPRHYNY